MNLTMRVILIISFIGLFACGKNSSDTAELGSAKSHSDNQVGSNALSNKKTIAVIPKGTTHEFWKSVHAGAVKAGKELGIKIIWKGPVREDDRDEQIKVVENFIASGVDGIVLAPLDDIALVGSVRDAKREGIPTVIFDSSLKWDGHISFVATDNYRGGVAAATQMGNLLKGTGKVIVLR